MNQIITKKCYQQINLLEGSTLKLFLKSLKYDVIQSVQMTCDNYIEAFKDKIDLEAHQIKSYLEDGAEQLQQKYNNNDAAKIQTKDNLLSDLMTYREQIINDIRVVKQKFERNIQPTIDESFQNAIESDTSQKRKRGRKRKDQLYGVDYEKKEKMREIQCSICDQSIYGLIQMRWHMKTIHFVKFLGFNCDQCNKSMNHARQFALHMNNQHELRCNCNRMFATVLIMIKHLNQCPSFYK